MTMTNEINSERSIGAILIDSGLLTTDDAERVLKVQKERNIRFGDAAIELGLVSTTDIQRALSRQFDYPYLAANDHRIAEEVIAAFKPFSPVVEQLRALRSQMMLRWIEKSRNTLAIVSPARGEGRSFVAANLAVVFSQLGEKTLLIDADMRSPKLHDLFKQENKIGLSNVLAGRNTWADAVSRIPGLMDLTVLTSGPIPPNPQELLSRNSFNSFFDEVKNSFDIVIVDTPCGQQYSDVQLIAARCGAAIAIARKDLTQVSALKNLAQMLEQNGVTLVGTLLNKG